MVTDNLEYNDNNEKTEYFKKGTQPTEVSDRYAKLDNIIYNDETKFFKL